MEGRVPAKSITAYDSQDRVSSYDHDMELMHPRRTKMIGIALEMLLDELQENEGDQPQTLSEDLSIL